MKRALILTAVLCAGLALVLSGCSIVYYNIHEEEGPCYQERVESFGLLGGLLPLFTTCETIEVDAGDRCDKSCEECVRHYSKDYRIIEGGKDCEGHEEDLEGGDCEKHGNY